MKDNMAKINVYVFLVAVILMPVLGFALSNPCHMTVKIATPPAMKTPSTITAITIIGGGTAPYNYAWGNGTMAAECLLPNEAQKITVTVTDNAGCIVRDTLIVP